MTKRRIATHEECLKSFARQLKRDISENLAVWKKIDRKHAEGRRMAYANILFLFKQEAEAHGVPLMDLGLVDYEVPKIDDYA